MEQKSRQIAKLLRVLANEYRLLILCELIKEPKTVGALGEKINSISQPALSQHLSLLKAHGILDSSKSGQSVTYFLADSRVREIIALLKEHYCEQDE
ncbi:MAG TPA: metalloregulator ArsR/SmtB family transcription factor [Clostridia bacterium]|nr:MAG: putative HTH-type transcriptional regulator YgaV [Firmicutes bacterium ADurb.Bin356]HOF94790.1 metalloregulator ArsR/SmtB family transcription factor [Clostridia bacterium]